MLKHKVYNKAKGEFEPRQTAVTNDGGLIIRSVGRGWFEPADPENYHVIPATGVADIRDEPLWEYDRVAIEYNGERNPTGFIESHENRFYVIMNNDRGQRVRLENALKSIEKIGSVYESAS